MCLRDELHASSLSLKAVFPLQFKGWHNKLWLVGVCLCRRELYEQNYGSLKRDHLGVIV